MKSRLLFFLLALFCFQACKEANFDELETEVLPVEPVEVTEDEIGLTYRISNEEEVVYDDGFGVALHDTLGGSLYAIASGDFTCSSEVENDVIRFQIGGEINDFLIIWLETPDGDVFSFQATVKTVINGDTIEVVGSGNLLPFGCVEENPLIVNIEEETEEFIKGTYEGEFFEFVFDSTATELTCDNWQSVGILNADFFVPLGECQ